MGSVRFLRGVTVTLVSLIGDNVYNRWFQEHVLDTSMSLHGFQMIHVDKRLI